MRCRIEGVVFKSKRPDRGFVMRGFMHIKSVSRRRASGFSVGTSINDLEPRNLLSGATAPVAAVVGDAVPRSSQPPAEFWGYWEINGSSIVNLTLTQNGKKVSGPLVGNVGSLHFSLASRGKVDGNVMNIHGKGTVNGVKAKYTAQVLKTADIRVAGVGTDRVKGQPDESQPFNGFRPV